MKLLPKVVIFLLLTTAVSAALNIFLSGRAVHYTLISQLARAASARAEEMSEPFGRAFLTGKEKAFLPLLTGLQLKTGALYAQALDNSGLVLAHTNVARAGKRVTESFAARAASLTRTLAEETEIENGGGRAMRVTVPVFQPPESAGADFLLTTGLAEKNRLGTLDLMVPLAEADEAEAGLRRRLLFISLLISAGFFFTALFFFRRGIAQLRALGEGVVKIRARDYGLALPVLSNDELGELTADFNSMAGALSDTTVSKDYLDSVLENMPDPLFITGPDGRITKANRAAVLLAGERETELLGRDLPELLSADGGTPGLPLGELKAAGTLQVLDRWFVPRNRPRTPVILAATYIRGGTESGDSVVVMLKDLTESRRHQAAMREMQENFRQLVENAPDAIFVQFEGKFDYLNPEALRLFGAEKPEDLLGKDMFSRFHPDSHAQIRGRARDIAENRIQAPKVEEKYLRMDGTPFYVLASAMPMERAGKAGALVFFADITERKAHEAELLNMQKIESLGVLAGGIAHDFNNMLMGIISNLSLLEKRTWNDPAARDMLAETAGAAASAQHLTQQLLTFAKGGKPLKKIIRLDKLLPDSAAFSTRGSNCRCVLDLAEDIRPVNADENQIKQVVNNILVNAVQAMPEGGEIKIDAGNVSLRGDAPGPHSLEPGEYVRVVISDAGVGIPEKHLSKIFEPYFTTKIKGHGLGLAMTYSIIKNHGGHICAASRIGEGTSFTIYLPAAEGERGEEPAEKPAVRGSGRVLVMDDDAMVRKAVARLLAEIGYDSVCADDGLEALRIYEEALRNGTPFKAVITDLTVPGGMGGKELALKLRELDPGAKIIVSSGYSDDPLMSDYAANGFSAVLAKPYKLNELGAVLASLV